MKKMDFIFARAFLAGKVQKVQKCIGFNKKDFLGNVFSMTFEELCNSCTTRTKFYCLFLASYGSGFATFNMCAIVPFFQVHPWRRPASLRARPISTVAAAVLSKLSPSKEEDDVQLRRVHSFESDEK
jgi:hypothetical protein